MTAGDAVAAHLDAIAGAQSVAELDLVASAPPPGLEETLAIWVRRCVDGRRAELEQSAQLELLP